MTTTPPAEIGMPLEEVDTPALLVDLDAFERNLDRMATALEGSPVRLRPHSKTHKCAVIGRMQIARGAVGVCCQKVGEAEAMVDGGIDDVLVSNEVVGARKLDRLAALSRRARVAVCVDDPGQVAAIDAAAARFDTTLSVLVEINNGAGRCGVEPGRPAVDLARRIADAPRLRFGGLQAYQGRAQHIRDHAERRAAIDHAVALTRDTVEQLAAAGLECEIVGGAGTGTFRFEAASGVFNELQAGSYVFMDADYGRNLDAGGGPFSEFEHSLFVYATVMSKPDSGRAYLDAGLKAFSVDQGMPLVADFDGITVTRASDEHANLDLGGAGANIAVGDKIRLVPGHCDPTVNLYDWYVGIRNGRVESLWPIAARGAAR
ncbi:MAG: DSD1 family PLP-dependent enzyme [Chromatiales bacterium]|nr:DSD1 family PLP-dependent enzyme [Chromatiales bacterium]